MTTCFFKHIVEMEIIIVSGLGLLNKKLNKLI